MTMKPVATEQEAMSTLDYTMQSIRLTALTPWFSGSFFEHSIDIAFKKIERQRIEPTARHS
jgi:hypothetical protein